MRVKVPRAPGAQLRSSTSTFGAPRSTKDGVTVAKEIESPTKFRETLGAQWWRGASVKTQDLAVDGTTTATGGASHRPPGCEAVAAGMTRWT